VGSANNETVPMGNGMLIQHSKVRQS